MDEDNSDDDLPPISLSQEDSISEKIAMPSAREVAAERAREQHTERELQRLRELHSPPPPAPGDPPAPPRQDSSGSESETALAAAVRALHVLPAPATRPAPALALARRLLALLPMPPPTIQQYTAAFADDIPADVLRKHINRMVHSLSCALSCEYNAWTSDELVSCAGVLSAVCLVPPPSCSPASPRPAPAPRRALHRALAVAGPHTTVVARLAYSVAQAASADASGGSGGSGGSGEGGRVSAARALLALADCCAGGPARAELLAALLVRHALVTLLAQDHTHQEYSEPLSAGELHGLLTSPRGGGGGGCGGGGGWRALSAGGKHAALRLVARALRAARRARPGEGGERGEGGAGAVLAALAQPAHHSDKQHPDYLKVVVAASTLQLLFRTPQST